MRSFAIASAALLIAAAIHAQDPPTAPKPDYSRQTLLRFVSDNEIRMSPLPEHLPPGRIQWHIGWMEFRGLGMQWHIFYLPIVMPLAGSGLNHVAEIPNPLEMASRPIPAGLQIYPDRSAAVNREMKRVLKMEHEARAKAEP